MPIPKTTDIRKRSLQYALRAVELYRLIQQQKDGAGWILSRQFLRSATSIGANVEEAQFGESRRDFVHKYRIARKEAAETSYWLRLLQDSGLAPPPQVESLVKEVAELMAIFTKIIIKAERNANNR